jgi:hypothetical protein
MTIAYQSWCFLFSLTRRATSAAELVLYRRMLAYIFLFFLFEFRLKLSVLFALPAKGNPQIVQTSAEGYFE